MRNPCFPKLFRWDSYMRLVRQGMRYEARWSRQKEAGATNQGRYAYWYAGRLKNCLWWECSKGNWRNSECKNLNAYLMETCWPMNVGASGVKYNYMLGNTLYRTMAVSSLQVQRSHLRAVCIARIEGTRKARDVATMDCRPRRLL